MIRLPFVQAAGRCRPWVMHAAYRSVAHLHAWRSTRSVKERLMAETFLAEVMAADPASLEVWLRPPTAMNLPPGLLTAGAAAYRSVAALGWGRASPTPEEHARRVAMVVAAVTELRGQGLSWCKVATELRRRSWGGSPVTPPGGVRNGEASP